MLNRSSSPTIPTFQHLRASMRDLDASMPLGVHNARSPASRNGVGVPTYSTCQVDTSGLNEVDPNWRQDREELRRLRSQIVIRIERMIRTHQPHDVLTQVPENNQWQSKTFVLALKIERLLFLAAPSKQNYLNEHTLRSRVQLMSRHLVRIRKRKNAAASQQL